MGPPAVRSLLLALLLLLPPSCAGAGPGYVGSTRTDYNRVIQRTEDEQLLLNLVRLRYRDRPLFLEVDALTAQFSIEQSGSVNAEFGSGAGPVGAGGALAFAERPTISYTPLQGEKVVQRILQRVPLETLLLLGDSAWSIERVLRTCVDEMNGLENAPRATGPTPADVPEYADFLHACRLLRTLERRGGVSPVLSGRDGELRLHIEEEVRSSAEFLAFAQLLGLDPALGNYRVVAGVAAPRPDTIAILSRSFLGAMYFLSQSVDVPATDVAAGRVTVTRSADGEIFSWLRVTEGLMRIHAGPAAPRDAAVRVAFRGHWFWIDDSDLDAKSTFSLLGQIYALQSGGTPGSPPLLTIPVGG